MAIEIRDPNTIGAETKALFDVTDLSGKSLITSFKATIDSLVSHWKGSDATVNLKDLAMVYGEVTELVKTLQNLIVEVNNNSIIPIQKVAVACGGTCPIPEELAFTLGSCESSISLPAETTESWTDNAILQDAETFNSFPTTFETFVSDLEEKYDTLMKNWLAGASREEVVNLFENFKKNVEDYKTRVTKVRDNINTVAENKKTVMD